MRSCLLYTSECSKMGGKIVVCARSEETLKSVLDEMDGNGNTYITADITNQEDLTKLVSDMPVIDCLVISAGIGGTLALQFATREMCIRDSPYGGRQPLL